MPAAYADYLTHDIVDTDQVFTNHRMKWGLVRGYLAWRFGLQTTLPAVSIGSPLFRLFEPWRLKLDRFGRHLTRTRFPQPGRLLDVGCGAGDFLRVAIAMGWSACGCDPDPKVVEMCRVRGLQVRQGSVESWRDQLDSFDVVTLNQVIEHLHEPQVLLCECLQLLRPGGMLWLAFPNARAIGARVFQSAWAGLHPPYHLCLPTQAVLRRWLLEIGYERVVFQRRGAHARANWQRSRELASRIQANFVGGWSSGLGRVSSDALATFSPRWSEETVVLAWRPQN